MDVSPVPCLPDYDGAWIGAVIPPLIEHRQEPWLPAAVDDAATVVLLVLDGLGWNVLRDHAKEMPTIAAMQGRAITTVAPSTTGAALTSLTTGATPGEHGLVGWRTTLDGRIVNILRWESADGVAGPDPATTQPVAPFLGSDVATVTKSEFRGGGFTGAHLRGGTMIGYRTLSTLTEHVTRLAAGDRDLVYAYYDGIDSVAHEYGLTNGFFERELRAVDRLVGGLLDRLSRDTALAIVSDHGQVEVDHDDLVHLPLDELPVQVCSGESRFRYLHALPGRAEELLDDASDRWGDRAWVWARDELVDSGWLGAKVTDATRLRLGDVVLAAHAGAAFIDPAAPEEGKLVGRHGSLTEDEMLVPLVAARGTL